MKVETIYQHYADCVDYKHKLAEKIEDGVYVVSYKVWYTTISYKHCMALYPSNTSPTDRQLRKWKKEVKKWTI